MKADQQAHTWARSARTILSLTSESIAETLMLMNIAATEHNAPIFCLPAGISLNALMLNEIIQKTYHDISSQESDKNNMTVSQVALIGVTQKYPCAGASGSAGSNIKPRGLINPEPVTPISHVDGVILPAPPETAEMPKADIMPG